MRTTTLLMFFIPLGSFAQSNKTADVTNPVQVKSYSTSAGTFTVEYNNQSERSVLPEKIDYTEEIMQTSDGGTATYIFNKEAIEIDSKQPESIAVDVTIFPNPFNQTASVQIENINYYFENTEFIIYDLFGREVKRLRINNYSFQIQRENLSQGMYFYKISDDNNTKNVTGKFIIY